MWTSWRSRKLIGIALGMMAMGAFVFGACGGGDDDEPNGGQTPVAGEIDYGSLGGSIRIDGSSTVFPISEAVAEEFSRVADTRVNVAFSGTGGGFEKFCRGEIDVSNASRPIEDDEVAACAEEGITDIVELQVAIDALTVVVNPDNDFAECLTVQQLHDAFKTGGVNEWSELDPSWPAEDIEFFFPGTDSGTFDYFVEAAIEGVEETATHRGDGTASEDDNVLAQGVEGSDNGLGYFGFAYFQEAGQSLRGVAIDNGEGCVAPTLETALDGSYAPLSRPLFIYTRESLLREKPEMLGFVDFYLENSEFLTQDVGYIPLPDDVLAAQKAKIEPFLP